MSSKLARLPPIQGQRGNPPPEGPHYRLSDSQVTYQLPSPNDIRPYVDTTPGVLDTWPAHASGQLFADIHKARPRDSSLSGFGKEDNIPKPKFLEQLESYLQKELRALDCPRSGPNELRLQVHREVFEYLIEDFKTYKALLANIKNEYEQMLSYQRVQLRELEPMKQMLVSVSEKCDQKIVEIRDQERQDMIQLKEETRRLYRKIDSQNQDNIGLQAQIERLKDELASEYLKYRNECDARRMLVQDFNELKFHAEKEESVNQHGDGEGGEDEQVEDPVLLKISLKKTKEGLTAVTKQLTEMQANYGDVVPRRDFEKLTTEFQEYKASVAFMEEDNKRLIKEHEALQQVHDQVVGQRNEYYLQLEQLKRAATPRPKWNKCANYIQGGVERWKQLTEDRGSDQMVDLLLAEISGADIKTFATQEHFNGMGSGADVPRFLRYEGQIRNRNLGKKDTLNLLKDFWKQRVADIEKKLGGHRDTLGDFMYNYLATRFGSENIYEYGYNLLDACNKYSFDEFIRLSRDILNKTVDEEIYYDREHHVNELSKLLETVGNGEDTISKDDAMEVFKDHFKFKSQLEINRIGRFLYSYLDDNDQLSRHKLLAEDDSGRPSRFLQLLVEQEEAAKSVYIDEIHQQLMAQIGDAEEVSLADMKSAMLVVDPDLTKEDMDKRLSWVYGIPANQLGASPLGIEPLVAVEKLKTTVCNRLSQGT